MNTLNTNSLFKRIQSKGIKTNRGDSLVFNNYRYFQLVNAYKSLFVTNVMEIDGIENEIFNNPSTHAYYKKAFDIYSYIDAQDLFLKVIKRITDKYGLLFDSTKPKEYIKKINYIHHKYSSNAYIKDFIRVHKFEIELRSILLSTVLEIEERLKNTFCNTLNNNGKPANYLLNLNNYDLRSFDSIKSLQKNIGKTDNNHSKPMVRKREQELIPPYWLIINDLTLGETIKTISNLESTIKFQISKNIASIFTGKSVLSDKEIRKFMEIIRDIGYFRNILAHNQPLFDYNVSQCDLSKFPSVLFKQPIVKNPITPAQISKERAKIILSTMDNLKKLYGVDTFNSRVNANLDLSYMIYVINKIDNCINPNSEFSDKIREVYSKFSLFNSKTRYEKKDEYRINSSLQAIQDTVNQLNENLLNEIVKDAVEGNAYKRKLSMYLNQLARAKKVIIREAQASKYKQVNNLYKPFLFSDRYTLYTGVNSRFLTNL